MQAIAFDTLKFAQKLRDKAKFTPEQAEQTAVAFSESFGEWQGQANVATQEDLQKLELVLRSEILHVQDSIKSSAAETRAEILKWMFGTAGLQVLAILGALFGLLHNIGKL